MSGAQPLVGEKRKRKKEYKVSLIVIVMHF